MKDETTTESSSDAMRIPAWVFVLSVLLAFGGYYGVRATNGDPSAWFVAVLVALPIYLLPSYIGRQRKNARAIFALNALLGWTFLGWVIALVWALKRD